MMCIASPVLYARVYTHMGDDEIGTSAVITCPWCDRFHVMEARRCGVFVCGNDSGMPGSIVERVLRAKLSQHATETTLAVVRARMPAIGCFRQFGVAGDGGGVNTTGNGRGGALTYRMQDDRPVLK